MYIVYMYFEQRLNGVLTVLSLLKSMINEEIRIVINIYTSLCLNVLYFV